MSSDSSSNVPCLKIPSEDLNFSKTAAEIDTASMKHPHAKKPVDSSPTFQSNYFSKIAGSQFKDRKEAVEYARKIALNDGFTVLVRTSRENYAVLVCGCRTRAVGTPIASTRAGLDETATDEKPGKRNRASRPKRPDTGCKFHIILSRSDNNHPWKFRPSQTMEHNHGLPLVGKVSRPSLPASHSQIPVSGRESVRNTIPESHANAVINQPVNQQPSVMYQPLFQSSTSVNPSPSVPLMASVAVPVSKEQYWQMNFPPAQPVLNSPQRSWILKPSPVDREQARINIPVNVFTQQIPLIENAHDWRLQYQTLGVITPPTEYSLDQVTYQPQLNINSNYTQFQNVYQSQSYPTTQLHVYQRF
ncbi:hypothetical protein HK098_006043 [Nowakowskiella sp. JEL0407]|nr:hypothetical protein HK098_006043 [Nowakowskiella sp. JEL0407]